MRPGSTLHESWQAWLVAKSIQLEAEGVLSWAPPGSDLGEVVDSCTDKGAPHFRQATARTEKACALDTGPQYCARRWFGLRRSLEYCRSDRCTSWSVLALLANVMAGFECCAGWTSAEPARVCFWPDFAPKQAAVAVAWPLHPQTLCFLALRSCAKSIPNRCWPAGSCLDGGPWRREVQCFGAARSHACRA